MNAQITEQDILVKAYDLLEDGRSYTTADFSLLKEEALEALLAEDERDVANAVRARECAKLRDFKDAPAAVLAADYAKRGNAWPFSGDHLNTYDIYEELANGEQGDVVGRVRR